MPSRVRTLIRVHNEPNMSPLNPATATANKSCLFQYLQELPILGTAREVFQGSAGAHGVQVALQCKDVQSVFQIDEGKKERRRHQRATGGIEGLKIAKMLRYVIQTNLSKFMPSTSEQIYTPQLAIGGRCEAVASPNDAQL